MKRRACLTLPLILAAPSFARSVRAAGQNRLAGERFRFHAGAPLLAPAGVADDGGVCVGTVDGYVHALAPDGDFRWSHSVQGAVTQRPLRSGALWFIATSAERIYALTDEGTLYWMFQLSSAPKSELIADASGGAYFVSADGFLFGISAHGAIFVRTSIGALKAGPCADENGVIWAENTAGIAFRAHGREVTHASAEARAGFDFARCENVRDDSQNTWRISDSGELEAWPSNGARPIALDLGSRPVLSPTWSRALGCVVASTREGLVIAFEPMKTGAR